ncbi:CRE-ELL-1 protein [Ditylenchus destructor]|uniref:CRE-ELL-1 protein n=1 Tax=Ditylenchus destructor TaxID=166010 RepID=A0AAD4NDQ5_9BILA|nr:CRE-ELL-1 protein [Ditylenchus destructor]
MSVATTSAITAATNGGGVGSPVPLRNPAPHRGFNSKAREVLLDPIIPKAGAIPRSGSDEEFLRKVSAMKLNRTDSEATNGSQKSRSSSHGSNAGPAVADMSDFDGLDQLPKSVVDTKKDKVMLGDIGKTRSAGDLFKNQNGVNGKKTHVSKTFQQMNIMKLPSVDSDLGPSGTNSRSQSLAGFDGFTLEDGDGTNSARQSRYEIK